MSNESTALNRRILQRISEVSSDLDALRRVQMEVASSGTSSATLSSGGGSKSYTRLDLNTIASLIASLENQLAALRRRLTGASPIRRIMFTR